MLRLQTTLIFTIIVILTALLFSSSSMAQNDVTPTPEITPDSSDADLMEEFEAALTYETGPGYSEDKPCDLPCWWGMTPGITPEEEVIDILKTTGFYRNWDLIEYGILFDSSEGPVGGSITLNLSSEVFFPFQIGFGAQNGTLTGMTIKINEPTKWFPTDQFYLDSILDEFDETLVILAQLSRAHFNIILHYPGILLFYDYYFINTPSSLIVDERGYIDGFNICSRDNIIHDIRIVLFDPEDQERPNHEIYNSAAIVPLDQIAELDSETFINFFRETPNDCLAITLKGTNGAE